MVNSKLLALMGLAAATASPSRLIQQQVEAYKRLLNTKRLTADGFRKIFELHDSDSICVNACGRYLDELVSSPEGMEWTRLEELLDEIYGDAISNDPYDPQEVHIALTGTLSEMKVMWASMNELQDPFVEYTASENEWADDNLVMKSVAITSTYATPQNWYPIFAGVLYEANMVNLLPGKASYKYRVGGFDPINATIRYSQDFTFHSAPEPNPEQKTTFATFGDQVRWISYG